MFLETYYDQCASIPAPGECYCHLMAGHPHAAPAISATFASWKPLRLRLAPVAKISTTTTTIMSAAIRRKESEMPKMPKYPPYPGSNWDYSIVESARQALRKPNRNICLYCHAQAVTTELPHAGDCPARTA